MHARVVPKAVASDDLFGPMITTELDAENRTAAPISCASSRRRWFRCWCGQSASAVAACRLTVAMPEHRRHCPRVVGMRRAVPRVAVDCGREVDVGKGRHVR